MQHRRRPSCYARPPQTISGPCGYSRRWEGSKRLPGSRVLTTGAFRTCQPCRYRSFTTCVVLAIGPFDHDWNRSREEEVAPVEDEQAHADLPDLAQPQRQTFLRLATARNEGAAGRTSPRSSREKTP
jgi:hypothetical protein